MGDVCALQLCDTVIGDLVDLTWEGGISAPLLGGEGGGMLGTIIDAIMGLF